MSNFTILYWLILSGAFITTGIIIRIFRQYSMLDIILICLKTILLSTTVLWASLHLSYKRLPGMPSPPNHIGSTAGFPFEAFKYPVACLGHDVPPVEQWFPFFLNFGIIHLSVLIIMISLLLSRYYGVIHSSIKTEIADNGNRKGMIVGIGLLLIILILNSFFLIMVSLAFD